MSFVELSSKQRLGLGVHIIFQQLLAVFVLSIVWFLYINLDWTSKGTWHIFLSTIGFALFMAEAVVVFNSSNIFTIGIKKVFKGYIHGTFMFLACLCVTSGVAVKISQKADFGASHFTSTHGKLGLSAWILTMVAVGGGVVVQYVRHIPFIRPVIIKLIHNFVGMTAYVIGCVTIGYGIDSYLAVTDKTSLALEVILGIYVAYSLIGPLTSLYNHLKSVCS